MVDNSPKIREVFEAFLTDPVRINEHVYTLWLRGLNATDALTARLSAPPTDALWAISGDKTRELLWRDTVDQYRLLEKLEHYLLQPRLFRSQLLFQIPPLQQHFLLERYYALDGHVARWLLGKKVSTAKIQKDLDEISDHAQRTLKNCRRQLDNLRRVYVAMEERNFQGGVAAAIRELFGVSDKLASKYACVLFLLHARLEVHPSHRATRFLTWQDLLFMAAVMMVHWIPQRRAVLRTKSYADTANTSAPPTPQFTAASPPTGIVPMVELATPLTVKPVENGADICFRKADTREWPSLAQLQERIQPAAVRNTVGLDLSMHMTDRLRDLKAHLINDNEALAVYRGHVMVQLQEVYASESMQQLSVKLYLVVHGLLTIGAGLSQPKELKDLLGNLVNMVIRVLLDCGITSAQLDHVFAALIDSLAKLNVWYLQGNETRSALLASWDGFLCVCRALVLVMYDRVDASQL